MPFKKQSGSFPVILLMHTLAFANLSLFSGWTLLVLFAMQFGVHAGFHRWCSHRSYEPRRWVGFVICALGCLTLQYGPLWWATHHQRHHTHCETALDPHTPNKGFLHSHMAWLWREDIDATNPALLTFWARDRPEIVWLDRIWVQAGLLWSWNLSILLLFGPWSIIELWVIPVVCCWHLTWATNSLAHRPSPDNTCNPRNNLLVGWLNLGEGVHASHHLDPASACHGFARAHHVDVVFLVLAAMERVGLISKLKRSKSPLP